MTSAELIVRCLEREQLEFLFTLPGEEVLDLLDALHGSRIRVVTVRHEQGAAFMADVYGRLTGKAGVCLATLGPGATNLLTGIADAFLDRVPLIAITGQVSLARMHTESHQYLDVMGLFRPVTKWQARITTPDIIPEAVRKSFKVAEAEKPGPAHLELPEDVAGVEAGGPTEPLPGDGPPMPEPLERQIKRAADVIGQAKRPLLLAGNGLVRQRAHEALRRFARRARVPVVHTFMGKGLLPDSDPLSLFTLGLRRGDRAWDAVRRADVVICAGYDFVEYAPCLWNADRDKRVVHVDVSPAEVDMHYPVEVEVLGDPSLSLEQLAGRLGSFDGRWAMDTRNRILEATEPRRAAWPLLPQTVMRAVRAALRPNDVIVCDVGAHKLWMASLFPCEWPNTCLISNGLAAMGIGIPGAVSAKLAHPDRQVMAVVGDGGFLMAAQELETAVRLGLPLVVLVWRDDGYGVIRMNQLRRFGRTTAVDFANPDFVRYATSLGAEGFRVASPEELAPCLAQALASSRPAVIDCPVDYSEPLGSEEER